MRDSVWKEAHGSAAPSDSGARGYKFRRRLQKVFLVTVLPPRELVGRIGPIGEINPLGVTWRLGRQYRELIDDLLLDDWDWTGKRILDFGCGAGRILRNFLPEMDIADFWDSKITIGSSPTADCCCSSYSDEPREAAALQHNVEQLPRRHPAPTCLERAAGRPPLRGRSSRRRHPRAREELERSSSWRLTAPLRAARRRLRPAARAIASPMAVPPGPRDDRRSIVPPMLNRPREAIVALRRHLNRSLFTEGPDPAGGIDRVSVTVVVVAFLVIATLLQMLRIGAGNAIHSLWAEDGPIFFGGALHFGFFTNVFETYAGYLVVVPRLVGEVGAAVPLEDAPTAMAIVSGLIVGVCGIVVWVAAGSMIRNPYLRGTLVILTVLAPTGSLESVDSGTYVIWFMLFASFWLLLWRPRTTAGAALGGVFLLLTALSTPEVWFFAPVALLRLIALRDRRDALLLGGWAIGSLAQVPAYAFSDEPQVSPLYSHDIWTALLQRVLDGAALGERLGGVGWDGLGWALLIFLIVLTAIGLAIGLRRTEAQARWLAGLGILIAVAMFVLSAYQRAVGPEMAWPANVHFGDGGRYTIVPALLLVSIALALVDQLLRRPRTEWLPRLGPWLAGLTIVVLLVGMAFSFDVGESAARGTPHWSEALEGAAHQCKAEPGASEAPVPTSPPPYGVYVPCAELIDAVG